MISVSHLVGSLSRLILAEGEWASSSAGDARSGEVSTLPAGLDYIPDRFRVLRRHLQQHPRWTFGCSTSLFPIPQCFDTNTEQCGKIVLREPIGRTKTLDVKALDGEA